MICYSQAHGGEMSSTSPKATRPTTAHRNPSSPRLPRMRNRRMLVELTSKIGTHRS